MSLQYSTTHRSDVMTDLVTLAGTTAFLLIYSGTEPANCAASETGTLLASLSCANPIGSVASGVLTFGAIASASAAATGTASHWRLCTSSAGSTVIAQGTVGASGADINFAGGVSFTSGETISVSSLTLTAAGA